MVSCTHQMLYKQDGTHLPLEGMYRDRSLFITAGGPSLAKTNLDLLRQAGIVTMGINNSPKVFRPNLWISVDDPANFLMSIWIDPRIMKFCHLGKNGKTVFDSTHWQMTKTLVRDCPNVVYYKDNEWFRPEQFLTENTVNWGNHTNRCECGYWRNDKHTVKRCPQCKQKQWGSRSVFLSALRMAAILGFNKVYLLGCDFRMVEGGQNYAFSQARAHGSVKNNNATYARLNIRCNQLRPVFEKAGLYVWNCTPDSGLKSFDYMPLETAVEIALKGFPDVATEPTEGMYDRKANEKNQQNENGPK